MASHVTTRKLPDESILAIAEYSFDKHSPDYETLYNACLVSRQFARSFVPKLWHTIDLARLSQFKRKGRIETLMRLLAGKSLSDECRYLIKRIDMPEGLKIDTDVLTILGNSLDWIKGYYAEGFKVYLRSQICKRPDAEDSILALMMVLAPGLEELSWERRASYTVVASLFAFARYPNVYSRQYRGDETPVIANLKTFELRNAVMKTSVTRRPAKIQPFFVGHDLESIAVDNICCVGALDSVREIYPAPRYWFKRRLLSVEFTMSTLGAILFESLLRYSPHLRKLVLEDHFFRPAAAPDSPVITLGRMGDTLRTYGQSLTHLELHHRDIHPFHDARHEFGHLGSLKSLTNLRYIAINQTLLSEEDGLGLGSISVSHSISGLLPTSLEELLIVTPTTSTRSEGLEMLKLLQRNAEFQTLSRVAITAPGDDADPYTPKKATSWKTGGWQYARYDKQNQQYKLCRVGHELDEWVCSVIHPSTWGSLPRIPGGPEQKGRKRERTGFLRSLFRRGN
ncbi:uncharacterized protein B0I36DRAFT_354043 [Microdochium trichocladiopsis]|uniref:Uncharacterized protein n=1 Tax=Microdochium trichocladiopsis TaxID=1682393 RepID=A0A9P8XWB5_9PEZI|nr:uncharacterized protein B0I36DRAFT_354043 [Microdochium trichocladiopsis]KAH7021378.1 hypothetical protein B0I36DRAFT_354043 [Microdochium trichocladiopsis]